MADVAAVYDNLSGKLHEGGPIVPWDWSQGSCLAPDLWDRVFFNMTMCLGNPEGINLLNPRYFGRRGGGGGAFVATDLGSDGLVAPHYTGTTSTGYHLLADESGFVTSGADYDRLRPTNSELPVSVEMAFSFLGTPSFQASMWCNSTGDGSSNYSGFIVGTPCHGQMGDNTGGTINDRRTGNAGVNNTPGAGIQHLIVVFRPTAPSFVVFLNGVELSLSFSGGASASAVPAYAGSGQISWGKSDFPNFDATHNTQIYAWNFIEDEVLQPEALDRFTRFWDMFRRRPTLGAGETNPTEHQLHATVGVGFGVEPVKMNAEWNLQTGDPFQVGIGKRRGIVTSEFAVPGFRIKRHTSVMPQDERTGQYTKPTSDDDSLVGPVLGMTPVGGLCDEDAEVYIRPRTVAGAAATKISLNSRVEEQSRVPRSLGYLVPGGRSDEDEEFWIIKRSGE